MPVKRTSTGRSVVRPKIARDLEATVAQPRLSDASPLIVPKTLKDRLGTEDRFSARPAVRRPRKDMFTGSFMMETNGGGRLEHVPGFNAAKVMSQGFEGGGRVPDRFRGSNLGTAAELEFAFPESACGQDDRQPITNTGDVPWRCICQLIVEGLHGTKLLGTGWLAGRRTIITAGHNLYSRTSNTTAARVWVFPGRTGDHMPFGYFVSQWFTAHPRWLNEGDPLFDYGAVFLARPIGDKLGWFGYAALTNAQLEAVAVNNAGYPADKPPGTMWYNGGRIAEAEDRMIVYGLDTEEGQSGSPVFFWDANHNRVVVGIHAYGGCPENRGIRVTGDVYALISQWANS